MNSLVKFWREFDFRKPPFIHPRDLERFGSEPEFANRRVLSHQQFIESGCFPGGTGFHFSLFPVPYLGDLDRADIVVLLLNPGFSISNYQAMRDREYVKWSVRNLRQDLRGSEFPFMSLNPNLASTAGFQWWHGKLAKVIACVSEEKGVSYLEALRMLACRVAAVEMVPYRSKSFGANRLIKEMPSAVAARNYVQGELLAKAKKGKVTLIVTRKFKEWGIPAGDAVIYKGGHTRGAHLGPNSAGGKAILKRFGL